MPRPWPHCVRWGPSSPSAQPPVHSPQFPAHVNCGQTARWIKTPLDTEVGLGPGYIVLDEDPAPPPRKGALPPIFGPCLLWQNSVAISATAEHSFVFYFLYYSFVFVLVPSGRLRLLFVSFWVYVNTGYRIVLYRIVYCHFDGCTSSKMCRSSSAMSLTLSGPAFYGIEFSTRAFLVPLYPFRIFSVPAI